jgi:hypothetical protein
MLSASEKLKSISDGDMKANIEANSLVICEVLEGKEKENLRKDVDRIRNHISLQYE